jgi:hypothetical protein
MPKHRAFFWYRVCSLSLGFMIAMLIRS